jgi:hypothetical protein
MAREHERLPGAHLMREAIRADEGGNHRFLSEGDRELL